jgi:hypothetical protein
MNKKLFALALSGLLLGSITSSAMAEDWAQKHPRRAEVMHRDHHMGNEMRADKGHLDGHYKQLAHEDRGIHRQERRDERMHDGHITPGEQKHLNREENHMHNQIKHDDHH